MCPAVRQLEKKVPGTTQATDTLPIASNTLPIALLVHILLMHVLSMTLIIIETCSYAETLLGRLIYTPTMHVFVRAIDANEYQSGTIQTTPSLDPGFAKLLIRASPCADLNKNIVR